MPLFLRDKLASAPKDNKSMLSYWPGVGIAGSTKHIPGHASVGVPTKCAVNQRAEPPSPISNQDLKERAFGAEAQQTQYAQTYAIDPRHDYSMDPRSGGGYALRERTPAPLVEPKPFLAESTYQAEISRAAGGGGGCRDALAAAPSIWSGGRPPAAAAGAIKPGYLTTAAAAALPLQHKLAAAGAGSGADSVASGKSLAPGPGRHGSRVDSPAGARSSMFRFEGSSTYGSTYSGDAPRVTEELNRGTPKTSLHVPGYCGHVPSEADLVLAGLSSRVKKEDSLLYHLDQHSRGLVAGYTGHKPAHKPSVSLQAPAPTVATTQGAAHQQALRWADRTVPDAPLNSRAGVLSFFSSGSGGGAFVSESGQADAAMFHQKARPYEGFMRIPHASTTNRHGAKFSS